MTHPNEAALNAVELPQRTSARRERLRFTGFDFSRTPSGRCTAEVQLEWIDGAIIVGRAEGLSSPLGDYRIAAEATLRAIEDFTQGELKLDLIGVKAMKAFDANVVIVAVTVRGSGSQRLLGCHLAESDPMKATVVAVLGATNRVLGNFLAR